MYSLYGRRRATASVNAGSLPLSPVVTSVKRGRDWKGAQLTSGVVGGVGLLALMVWLLVARSRNPEDFHDAEDAGTQDGGMAVNAIRQISDPTQSTGGQTVRPGSSKAPAWMEGMAWPTTIPVWQPWSPEERAGRFQSVIDGFFEKASGFSIAEQLHARADKGMEANALLVEVNEENELNLVHSWESPSKKHSRYVSLVGLLEALVRNHKLPKVSFLVVLNDGSETKQAVFSAARHTRGWKRVIPFPVGNSRGWKEGFGLNFTGWDEYSSHWYTSRYPEYPWEKKLPQAVFRGNFPMSEMAQIMGSCFVQCRKTRDWRKTTRGTLYLQTVNHPDLFDVQFTSKAKNFSQIDEIPVNAFAKIPLHESMKYKYVLNVGANADWAERLRNLMFLNSAILRHEAGTQEWFYPLLEPFVHYIPFHVSMNNLVDVVQWGRAHDDLVQQIVRNANAFAANVLSEAAMLDYARLAVHSFAAKQAQGSRGSISLKGPGGRRAAMH
ncbi:Protein O-glucosyltransferase 1 [Porphyridium purpureum]|uniref:Protein O-glucosyltransferase 1 n=1 Tax=Porphyridium purpureum TaxID=35688 RepID=A0A5J4Z463_PORPP|nr:Protein O-glucosyltransferase 1 [Porphyridium purpureum]|eukprot:POR7527..scf295_1